MEITIEPVIIAATLSAAVAIFILLLTTKKLEPQRWKKNAHLGHLQKQLEVYGQLTFLLQSCRVKATRQNLVTSIQGHEDLMSMATIPTEGLQEEYLLENPYDADRFHAILEQSNYLLSNGLKEEWLNVIREDSFFAMFGAKKREPQCLLVKLRQMHKIAETEYDSLKLEYETLTGIHIPKEHLT